MSDNKFGTYTEEVNIQVNLEIARDNIEESQYETAEKHLKHPTTNPF